MGENLSEDLEAAKSNALAALVQNLGEEDGPGVDEESRKKKEGKYRRRRRGKKKSANKDKSTKDISEGVEKENDNNNPDVKEEREIKEESTEVKEEETEEVQVEYVLPDDILLTEKGNDEEVQEFREVFKRFQALGAQSTAEEDQDAEADGANGDGDKNDQQGEDEDGSEADKAEETKLSRKQRKMMDRFSVANLKQEVKNPAVVEPWDVTAADPKLLVHLKSYRNSVQVPVHWRQKRKYLQNKRGMHKAPFQLPAFIEETGIQKMREAYAESDESKSLKQKQREKIRPKMGKADIDYQVLHDAFFKFQTKPNLSEQGDLYYELRELEVKKKSFRPGVLSEGLRVALGMTEALDPPPWLYNMQRYPPPPSYPYLKIPGFNAPIPQGATYGDFQRGWGRPPVDAMNRPLYGDVFGMGWMVDQRDADLSIPEEQKSMRWGEYGDESEEEEEEEEDEEEEQDEEGAGKGVVATESSAAIASGIETSSSVLPGGLETPADAIELRKGVAPKQLYTVVEEKKASVGSGLLGTSHVYDLAGGKKKLGDGIEVSLNPEDLESGLNEEMLKKKVDQKKAEDDSRNKADDVSDIVAEGLARKRKEIERDKEKKAKRTKDLKF